MIGIYKITSPSNKVYIGQSINIKKRFNQYKWSKAKQQPILHNSFLKYGVKNHVFEIVCICKKSELHNLEVYYQEIYSVTGVNGLNCFINTEENINKVLLKKIKYKKEEELNEYYLKNKQEFLKISNIIDSFL